MSLEKYKLSSLKDKHNEQEKQRELGRALADVEKPKSKVEEPLKKIKSKKK